MTRKTMILCLFLLIIMILCVYYFYHLNKVKANKRYDQIYDIVGSAVQKQIDNTFVIKDEYNCKNYVSQKISSQSLIRDGYLNEDDMIDIDNKHYCKALAVTNITNECNVTYKIFLNCKNRVDEGYFDWGE